MENVTVWLVFSNSKCTLIVILEGDRLVIFKMDLIYLRSIFAEK